MEYDDSPLTIFRDALPNPQSRASYERKLKNFLEFLNLEGESFESKCDLFVSKCRVDQKWAVDSITAYIRHQKLRAENSEINASTLTNYFKPIKLFFEMNDIVLNWKKITRGLPKGRRHASDRSPRLDEIKKLLGYPDRRVRPAVLIMMSSGIRLGAWEYLRWGDITPINDDDGKTVAAKIIVYRGDREEYVTFITPEAYQAIKEYVDFRTEHGEKITETSWVLRNEFNVEKSSRGIASIPKKLKSSGFKRLIERALVVQGIRKPLADGKRRHEFQADHGFRKYFKTVAERHMKSLNVEILMGHSVGLADSYYRVSENDLLAEYLKCANDLSINPTQKIDHERIKNQDEMLTVKAEFADLLGKYLRKEKLSDDELTQRYTILNHLRIAENGKGVIVRHEDKEIMI